MRELLANLLCLNLHVLFNSVRSFAGGLETLFGDHHLSDVDVHGFLRLYQAVFPLHHELFEGVNIDDLLGIEHELTYLIFFVDTVGGILFF